MAPRARSSAAISPGWANVRGRRASERTPQAARATKSIGSVGTCNALPVPGITRSIENGVTARIRRKATSSWVTHRSAKTTMQEITAASG